MSSNGRPEPGFATIRAARDFGCPVEILFAHWTSPETRIRWEAGPESGMRYLNFDTREGGVERLQVSVGGQMVGEMVQRITVMRANEVLVSTITGHFGGRITMVMQVTCRFEKTASGSRLSGTSQVLDLTRRDVANQYTAGWNLLLDNFAADLVANPLATRAVRPASSPIRS